jgi:hypothetical protein
MDFSLGLVENSKSLLGACALHVEAEAFSQNLEVSLLLPRCADETSSQNSQQLTSGILYCRLLWLTEA